MHKYILPILAVAVLALTACNRKADDAAAAAPNDDWPSWRGVERNGFTPSTVPLPWPEEGPKV